MTKERGFFGMLSSWNFSALDIQAGLLSILLFSESGLQVGFIGGEFKACFSGKACVNDGLWVNNAWFACNSYVIAGNQVESGSSDYYNQFSGIAVIYGLSGLDKKDSLKASYILDYVSIILWKITLIESSIFFQRAFFLRERSSWPQV